MLTAAAVVGKL